MVLSELIGTLRNAVRQWKANISGNVEFKAYVEASLVKNELRRIETKMDSRLDTLESYVDDVVEKYLRKISARENRERKKEIEEAPQIVTDPYEEIKRRHGYQ